MDLLEHDSGDLNLEQDLADLILETELRDLRMELEVQWSEIKITISQIKYYRLDYFCDRSGK